MGPNIHAIKHSKRHTAFNMRLDMTMQQKRAGIDDLITHRQPSGPFVARQEIIPIARIDEIEALRLRLDGVVHARPIPLAGVGADDVGLVAVFVHGMRELDGFGRGPADLEDEVDPGAVFGAEHEAGVFGFGGVFVPEERVVGAAVHGVGRGGVGGVLPGVAEAAELEVEELVGVLGDGRGVKGREDGGVEGDDGVGDVGAGVVDIGDGGGFARAMGVGEDGESGDGLVKAGVGDADGVVAGFVVQFDHGAVPLAIPDRDRLRQLRVDVVAVDGVDPHGMFVDGDGERFHARAADPVDAGPFVVGFDVDGLVTSAAIGGGADILEARGKEFGVSPVEVGSLRVENVWETSGSGFSESSTLGLLSFRLPFCGHRDVAKRILHVWCLQTNEIITSRAVYISLPIYQDAIRATRPVLANLLAADLLALSNRFLTNY